MTFTHNIRYLALLLTLFFGVNLYAAQKAIVLTDKAIIYGDRSLSHPIGYLRRGTMIKVGDNPRRAFSIIPTVLTNGRIGYVKMVDIKLNPKAGEDYKQMKLEHEIRFEEKDSYFDIAVVGFNTDASGSQLSSMQKLVNEVDSSSNIVGGFIGFERFSKKYKVITNLNIGYSSLSNEDISMTNISIEGGTGFSLISNKLFSVTPTIGLKLFTYMDLAVAGDTDPHDSAAFGGYAGVKFKLLPTTFVNVFADLRWQYLSVQGFEPVILEDDSSIDITRISGLSIYVGLGFSI